MLVFPSIYPLIYVHSIRINSCAYSLTSCVRLTLNIPTPLVFPVRVEARNRNNFPIDRLSLPFRLRGLHQASEGHAYFRVSYPLAGTFSHEISRHGDAETESRGLRGDPASSSDS